MTADEARALIAEGRKHDEAINDCVKAYCGYCGGDRHVGHLQAATWIRTNLARLLEGYAEALAEIERLQPVAGAATKWRHAQCDAPNECGDGYTHHGHDCPTNEHTRALVAAVDALEPKP